MFLGQQRYLIDAHLKRYSNAIGSVGAYTMSGLFLLLRTHDMSLWIYPRAVMLWHESYVIDAIHLGSFKRRFGLTPVGDGGYDGKFS